MSQRQMTGASPSHRTLSHVLSSGKGGFAVTINTRDLNHGAINYFRLSA